MMLKPGDMLLVPRNKLEKFSRFVKAANLGTYFNPLDLRSAF
jgi:polysaccharide export outer membrane protein